MNRNTVFLAIIALLFVALFAWWRTAKHAKTIAPPTTTAQRSNEEILNDGNVNEGERITLLLQLGEDPTALKVGLTWLERGSTGQKMAAINALGYFNDDKVLEAFKAAMPTLDEPGQFQILKSVTSQQTAARTKWIADIAQGTTPVAVAAKFFGRKSANGLVDALNKLGTASQTRTIAFMTETYPQDSVLLGWLLNIAETSKSDVLRATAIRHLASIKSKTLSEKINGLAQVRAPQVRAAALTAIPDVCPTDRWDIIRRAAKDEADSLVMRRLLDSLSFLRGIQANEVLAIVQQRASLFPPDLQRKIVETAEDLRAATPPNRCDR